MGPRCCCSDDQRGVMDLFPLWLSLPFGGFALAAAAATAATTVGGGVGAQDMVLVPASSGVMGILPRHAPTVAQLRPGVVEVHADGAKEKYFVSSGFAFVHKERTDVCAVAAAPVRGSGGGGGGLGDGCSFFCFHFFCVREQSCAASALWLGGRGGGGVAGIMGGWGVHWVCCAPVDTGCAHGGDDGRVRGGGLCGCVGATVPFGALTRESGRARLGAGWRVARLAGPFFARLAGLVAAATACGGGVVRVATRFGAGGGGGCV